MVAPVAGFGVSRRGGSRSAAAAALSHDQQTPETEALQTSELWTDIFPHDSRASTTGAPSSASSSRSMLIGTAADGAALAAGRPCGPAVAAGTLSSTAAVAPVLPCPDTAAPHDAASYSASRAAVTAYPPSSAATAAPTAPATTTVREPHFAVKYNASGYFGADMSAAATTRTAPAAVAQSQASTLRPPAGVVTPSSEATGSQCGSVSSSAPTYTRKNTWSPRENQAHAAIAGQPPPPPPVSSLPGVDSVGKRCQSSIPAGLAANVDPARSGSCSRLSSSLPSVVMTGLTAQQTPFSIASVAPGSVSLGDRLTQTPAGGPLVAPAACSVALLSSQTSSTKQSAAGQQPMAPQCATIPPSTSVGATNAPRAAHSAAPVAPPDLSRHTNLAGAFPAAVVQRVPLAAALPTTAATAGRTPPGAGAQLPLQRISSTQFARRVSSQTTRGAAATSSAVAAAATAIDIPAASLAATGSPAPLASVSSGGLAAASARKECDFEATSVLIRGQKLQQQDRNQAAAADLSSSGAAGADLKVSPCSYGAVGVSASDATTQNSVTSYPAVPSAAGAAATPSATTTGAVGVDDLVIVAPRTAARGPLLLPWKQSVVHASVGAQRAAVHGHLEDLQSSSPAAYFVAAAGHSSTPASQTVQKAPGATASTASTGNAAAARNLFAAAASSGGATAGTAGHVGACGAGAGSRTASLSGGAAAATLRSTCTSRATAAAPVTPAAAGFLQRTKRVPRESRRPPRRVLPCDITFQRDWLSPDTPAPPDRFLSRFAARPNTSPPSASAGTSDAPPGGTGSAASVGGPSAVSHVIAPTVHQQVNPRTPGIGSDVYFPSKVAAVDAAFRTPQPQERPPWRALTPQQLLLQRASKKRPLAGDSSNSQGGTSSLKSAFAVSTSLKEKHSKSSSKEGVDTGAAAGAPKPVISAAAAVRQHPSAETTRHPAAVAAAAAGGVAARPGGAEPTGGPVPQRPLTSVEAASRSIAPALAAAEKAAAVDSNAAAADASSATSPIADGTLRSSAGALASAAEAAEQCNSERRRTRKPSRLSLEAAETYSLTIAFRRQRRSSGRSNKSNPVASSDSAASFTPSSRRTNAGNAENPIAPGTPTGAAPETPQQQRSRQRATRTKRLRAETSPKRHAVQQKQQRHVRQQQCRQQEVEEGWRHLTSSQQEQMARYATKLQQQPVFLESCRFTLYPPGFASCPSAVRRVCLSGTLQQPVYVPSAASLSSVQQTLEWQQQETVAAALKCGADFCHVAAVESQISGAIYNCGSGKARGSTRISAGASKEADSSGIDNASGSSENKEGSVVGFIENTTVSGYIYHWYTRMHVSAQLETQLQQLSEARKRLTQQLRDGSEMHSNLFFFSLFPQDYGVEQFKQNLRFFPQYSVAAAAAEAAGLRPLELYADSSCTAAIADTARRAKLVEEFYEEDQRQQQRHVTEVAARAQDQQQHRGVSSQQHPQQDIPEQKTEVGSDRQQQMRKEGTRESSLASSKQKQQGDFKSALAQKKQECAELHFAATSASDRLEEKRAFLLAKRMETGVKTCKGEDSGHSFDSNIAPSLGTPHVDGGSDSVARTSAEHLTAAVFPARSTPCPVAGRSGAVAAGDGAPDSTRTISTTDPAVDEETEGNSSADSTPGTAAYNTEARSFPAEICTTGGHGSSVILSVVTDKQRHRERNTEICKRQTELTEEKNDEQEKANERPERYRTEEAEGRTAANSSVPHNIFKNDTPAAAPATAAEFGVGAPAAAKEGRFGVEEDVRIRVENEDVHVEGSDDTRRNEDRTDEKDFDNSSHDCSNIVRSDCNCEGSSAADVSSFASSKHLMLLDRRCTTRTLKVGKTCSSSMTGAHHDTDGNCSRRSSTGDNSSCDRASSRSATDSSSNRSINSCNNNTCTRNVGKDKPGDPRITTVEGEFRSGSSSSRRNGNMSKVVDTSCVWKATRRSNRSDTPGATSSSCSNESTGSYNHESVSVERINKKEFNHDKVDDLATTSSIASQSTTCRENATNRTASSDSRVSPAAATTAGETSLPARGNHSCRSRGDWKSSGNCSHNNTAKAEGIAEARYFPVIPRLGTVEVASMWRLIHAAEQLLLELHQQQEQEKPPQQLEEQLPLLVETLPDWWMDSVDWSMQQQLTALMLRRVLPGLAAWQGRDLRLVGSVLPFAARGLLALALCQLEHRIAMLQQQLAAAVGALQVLIASVLLLQPVEEYYAPPLYSLPQHVLACLYSRGGGHSVVRPSVRKRTVATHKMHRFPLTTDLPADAAAAENMATQTADRSELSAEVHKAGGVEQDAESMQKQESVGQKKADAMPLPSWETGIRQSAPVTVEGFVAYADAFEDYLPTLGREEASVLSILHSDTEDASPEPDVVRRGTRTGQKTSRTGAVSRSAESGNKIKHAFETGTKRGRRKKLPGKRGESSTKDSTRRSRNNSRRGATVKLSGRGRRKERNNSPSTPARKRVAAVS